jgi:hypothetical protein
MYTRSKLQAPRERKGNMRERESASERETEGRGLRKGTLEIYIATHSNKT